MILSAILVNLFLDFLCKLCTQGFVEVVLLLKEGNKHEQVAHRT